MFSRTLKQSGWNNTRMFGVDVTDTVTRLKRDTAKDLFLFGSADLASHLIPHGLIDEFRIALNPIILGGGTPLFKPGERIKLKLMDSRPLSTLPALRAGRKIVRRKCRLADACSSCRQAQNYPEFPCR